MNQYSQDIIDKLKALEPVLRKDFGIKRLRVFGSVARGEAKPGSDVDLIVEFSRMPGWAFGTMHENIGQLIETNVDLLTEDALNKHIKRHILEEVIDVYH